MPAPAGLLGPAPDASMFRIVDVLRRGVPMTRTELIAATGLGRRVVQQRLAQLHESGVVREAPRDPSSVGRPPAEVVFAPDAGRILVAHIRADRVRVGICDLDARLLDDRDVAVAYHDGPDAVLAAVEAAWDDLVSADGRRVHGVSLGVLGPVDQRTGETIELRDPVGWAGYGVRRRLGQRFAAPAWVDNEVNMLAIGEHRARGARPDHHLVFLNVDEGIGAGIIADGRVLRGETGVAGELGHIRVSDDPRLRCWCGGIGCLVEVASVRAVLRDAADLIPDGPTLASVLDAARAGDARALRLFEAAGSATGRALAAAVAVVNPSDVVIGGAMAAARDLILRPLADALDGAAFSPGLRSLTLSLREDDGRLGLIGAAVTAVDGLFSAPARRG